MRILNMKFLMQKKKFHTKREKSFFLALFIFYINYLSGNTYSQITCSSKEFFFDVIPKYAPMDDVLPFKLTKAFDMQYQQYHAFQKWIPKQLIQALRSISALAAQISAVSVPFPKKGRSLKLNNNIVQRYTMHFLKTHF